MQTQAISRRTPTAAAPAPTAIRPAGGGVRRFNPERWQSDFSDLMKVNPGLAAQTATKIAEIKDHQNRELNAAADGTADFVSFLLSTGIVALVGAWDGSMQARRNSIIESWELAGLVPAGQEPDPALWKAQNTKEPGKLLGVSWLPYSFLTPVILGALAVGVGAARDEGDPAPWYERTLSVSAISTWGLFIAGLTRSAGYRWQEKRMAAPAAAA